MLTAVTFRRFIWLIFLLSEVNYSAGGLDAPPPSLLFKYMHPHLSKWYELTYLHCVKCKGPTADDVRLSFFSVILGVFNEMGSTAFCSPWWKSMRGWKNWINQRYGCNFLLIKECFSFLPVRRSSSTAGVLHRTTNVFFPLALLVSFRCI